MEAHPQGLKDYPGATLEAHPGSVEVRNGAIEAHPWSHGGSP